MKVCDMSERLPAKQHILDHGLSYPSRGEGEKKTVIERKAYWNLSSIKEFKDAKKRGFINSSIYNYSDLEAEVVRATDFHYAYHASN